MTVAQDKVVSIHYKLINADNGDLIESSKDRPAMAYLHGANNLIPGLEKALEGKNVGDEFQVTIAPEDAYGPRHDSGVQKVPLEALKDIENIEVGMVLTAQTEQGPANLQIIEIGETEVTVDANHPLAGTTLIFDVSVESIRDASAEEIEHGHAHGPEGHQH
ncbi:FKBP-type peptidyl-prolyl cis-trans isomerase SlyD [gamma proteobacterium IMCC2047]|nr:FKBP-type peptidyl-prolyl cis-trans isomerase SlyD [gamma proteobacterium IMCC2047]